MCGIEKGSAVEKEELSELGLKVDKITEGVGIVMRQNAQQQESIDEVRELVTAKAQRLSGRALARQDKDRTLAEFEVSLDAMRQEPFARGGQGTVHLAEYQGDVVALKRMSLVGITAVARGRVMKAFSTELAIMVKLRSPRVVSVLGVVTSDPAWLGLVVEYMAGGTLPGWNSRKRRMVVKPQSIARLGTPATSNKADALPNSTAAALPTPRTRNARSGVFAMHYYLFVTVLESVQVGILRGVS